MENDWRAVKWIALAFIGFCFSLATCSSVDKYMSGQIEIARIKMGIQDRKQSNDYNPK